MSLDILADYQSGMESCKEQEQSVMHSDVAVMSPSQSHGSQATPHTPSEREPSCHHSMENGGTGARFHSVPPPNPQPTLSQFPSGPFADFSFLQSSPFQFPLDPIPSVGTRYPVGNTGASWTSEKAGHFSMMSAELCGAIASIIPDSEEENSLEKGFLRQDHLPEQRPLSRADLCPPASMTVFLKPLDPPEEGMVVPGATACQVLRSIDSGQQMVHCEPPNYMRSSSEPRFQGDVSEFGTPFQKVNAIQMGKVVPSSVPGLCPVLPQPYLAPPSLPLIRPTTTLLVPPTSLNSLSSLNSGYNFLSGPCFSQFHQTPCPVYPDSQPKMSPVRFSATYWDAKSRKPCSCTKSQCLKLYCDCFANGDICSNCKCINCYNNTEHEYERYQAIKICLDRNPEAFRPKIGNGKRGEIKGRHNKGCNCKRSGCLKNYCECYEAKIMCSSICKCVSCRNYDESPERQTVVSAGSMDLPDPGFYPIAKCQKKVVETTCVCLLAQAEEAEKEGHTEAQAERMILEEFGQCLTQIVQSIFKSGS
ncbi:spexin prohormone 2 isoform X2 [Anguilla rostrata]|uniref:spexin prohormone 2 isoform X2 n=1 Tax=Anguilla rostrata TaxID=7938 RepID=UPI0030CD1502